MLSIQNEITFLMKVDYELLYKNINIQSDDNMNKICHHSPMYF